MGHSVNKIVVCLGDHPQSEALIQAGLQKALETGSPWCVLHIELPPPFNNTDLTAREKMLRLLAYAQDQGAEVVERQAANVCDGIEQFAAESQAAGIAIHYLVIGKVEHEGAWAWLRPALTEKITRQLGGHCAIQVIPLVKRNQKKRKLHFSSLFSFRMRDVLFALFIVAATFGLTEMVRLSMPRVLFLLNDTNIALLFMIGCAFVAGRYGLVPGIVASIASTLTINYFYVVPYYNFSLSTQTEILNLALFLCAAIVISLFHGYIRACVEANARREQRTQVLYRLHRLISEAHSRVEALTILNREAKQMLRAEVDFFLPPLSGPDKLERVLSTAEALTPAEEEALHACFESGRPTGCGSQQFPVSRFRFEPLTANGGCIGVMAVQLSSREAVEAAFNGMLSAIADQIAAVIERLGLNQMMEQSRLSEEREKLRSMLLSSISHDLRTPLASIIGAISVHQEMRLSPDKREALLQTALEEAIRLDSFITNILDMTKLESGQISFRSEWQDPLDLVFRVRKRMQSRLRKRQVTVRSECPGVEVQMDPLLTEQVLFNVIDNAGKYTEAGAEIEITLGIDKGFFRYSIRDHGAGIPEDKLPLIFNKYTRLWHEDSRVAGTGLGLAIARGVMKGQNGNIIASNHPQGGAVFTLEFPTWRQTGKKTLPVAGTQTEPYMSMEKL